MAEAPPDVAVVVPAAGLGTRLGPGAPKALRELAGAPLLVHAVRRVAVAPSVGCVVVAAPAASVEQVRELIAAGVPVAAPGAGLQITVVAGGDTRQLSVAVALAAVPAGFPIVLVHDAARSFAPPELIERVGAAVRAGAQAVIPVLPVIDTVKQVDADGRVVATLDRSSLRVVQTPQGFRREILERAHREAAGDHTDDAGLAERIGVAVTCVVGDPLALKITRPEDLVLARGLLDSLSS